MDYEAWRCCRDTKLLCPVEGCPKSYGCARDKGWKPGDPSPRECQGLAPLENMTSHKNYNPREVAFARLMTVVEGLGLLSEGQLVRVTGLDRIDVRMLVDDGRDMLSARPLTGKWGEGVMERLPP